MGLNLMRIEDKLRPPAQIKREANRIVFSTEAKGLKAIDEAAKEERKRIEAERQSVMNTALKQPHRGATIYSDGDLVTPDDRRWETALGRLCLSLGLRKGCYAAGVRHLQVIREARVAKGLTVPGLVGEEGNGALACIRPDCGRRGLSVFCLCAAEANAERALKALDDAEAILRSIMARAPEIIRKLVYDDLTPAPNNEGLASDCLYRLGVHYGTIQERDYAGEMRQWQVQLSSPQATTAEKLIAQEMIEKIQNALDKSRRLKNNALT